jgi:phosphatidylserine/phosphatidylglycerophosphate/cardiolipin synthase-like enzyme
MLRPFAFFGSYSRCAMLGFFRVTSHSRPQYRQPESQLAKFLNTSATNYHLEELIKKTKERLIIISPFLKFNERIKELIEDKNRLKIDVRVVYGKSELAPDEINWLRSMEFVRTSFCQNLHAKCYLNESFAIITSMNLYDFSQINNNEMGVYIVRDDEPELYDETYAEVQRLIRISELVRLAAEKVEEVEQDEADSSSGDAYERLTTSRLAKALGMPTGELYDRLMASGYLERDGDQFRLTHAGADAGGEFRFSKKYGPYFLWPKALAI